MIKKLYTIGDSWTYGDELENPETECYPYLLSQSFNCELINKAICGGPNDWMFRKTIEWVCSQENLDGVAIIVGWSSVNRREENYKIYHGAYQDDGIDKFIFTKLYNDELAHYKSICYMVTLQEFLKSKNIKYLFFQPWYDILGCESNLIVGRNQKKKFRNWLSEDNSEGKGYSDKLEIGNMIENIDKKHCIGPLVTGYKEEYSARKIMSGIYGRKKDGKKKMHPNKNDHKVMCEFIKEKLIELYS